jgi:hypothetical protein
VAQPLDMNIIEALPLAEQKALFAKLSAKFNKSTTLTASEEAVWAAVAATLNARPRLEPFIASFGKGRYKEACAMIEQYLEDGVGRSLSRLEFSKLAPLILECLAEQVRDAIGPCTPTSLLSNLNMLAEAVDINYPAYHQCRLLGCLLTATAA